MQTFTVPLNALVLSPENVRKTHSSAELEAVAASLKAHGQLLPLLVKSAGESYQVEDGGRRLRAWQLLAEAGEIGGDHPIAVRLALDADIDGTEISLVANVMRSALHPADEVEAFHRLSQEDGLGAAEIAARFGIGERRVRQRLALGGLSPVILDAWRAGALGRDAVEVAEAFTLARSRKQQEEVFARLSESNSLWPHVVARQLGADNNEAKRDIAFVGREAYEAEGGTITEDLFGANHIVSDPALARRLAEEKLGRECARLVEAGWSWAQTPDALPDGVRWSWSRIRAKADATDEEEARLQELALVIEDDDATDEARVAAEAEHDRIADAIGARAYSAEDRARSGCIVSMGWHGELNVERGFLKPSKGGAGAGAKDGAKPKAAPGVSNALMHRLSVQATIAAREALSAEPRLGLVALLAGFVSGGGHGEPVRVRHEGLGERVVRRDAESFDSAFGRLSAMTDAELFAVAAGIAGQALDMQSQNAEAKPFRDSYGFLAAAIDADRMNEALRQKFDAADYFGSVARPLVLKAIGEAVNADEARKAGAMKKAELVAFAIANVAPTGWLPPELRTAHYAGPGAAKAEGKPKRKAASKKPRAKAAAPKNVVPLRKSA